MSRAVSQLGWEAIWRPAEQLRGVCLEELRSLMDPDRVPVGVMVHVAKQLCRHVRVRPAHRPALAALATEMGVSLAEAKTKLLTTALFEAVKTGSVSQTVRFRSARKEERTVKARPTDLGFPLWARHVRATCARLLGERLQENTPLRESRASIPLGAEGRSGL
jgi:hypothetical protein